MLKIRKHPDPILSQKAEIVKFPLDNETKTLIKDMWATVKDQGIGLAAPQVGASKQICIIHLNKEIAPKGVKQLDFLLINPKITFQSEVQNMMIEGCLSFPNEYYQIWRPANISLEYYTEQGKLKKMQASGWLSRVIQHEVDHLNGDLFIYKGGTKLDTDELEGNDFID